MINQRKMRKNIKTKSNNNKSKSFIAIWADDNGNGTFGILNNPSNTMEAAILEVIKDIRVNDYKSPNLDQCKLELTKHWELSIPGVINYKIESI